MFKPYHDRFSESALSSFQVVDETKFDSPFEQAEHFTSLRKKHMLEINNAWDTGNREKFFSLWDVIYKQEEKRNE